jgi:hypothetical protein
MTIDELIHQIKQNEDYWTGWAITPQQVNLLANLSVDEYDQIVIALLREPVADNLDLRGEDYRRTYAHLIHGAFLFCCRPNPDLYPVLLAGTIGIGDPSSIQYGAAALQLVKPTEQIVSDLFTLAELHSDHDEILSCIAWLFYWLGFSEDEKWGARMITIEIGEGLINLYKAYPLPETNSQEVAKMAQKAAEFMKAHYGKA